MDSTSSASVLFLNSVSNCATVERGIKSAFVDLFVREAVLATDLYTKIVIIKILHVTKPHILTKTLDSKLPDTLVAWMKNSSTQVGNKKEEQLLLDILNFLLIYPVDIETLKRTKLGRSIKKYSENNVMAIRDLATKIYDNWMSVIKSVPTAADPKRERVETTLEKPLINKKPQPTAVIAKSVDHDNLWNDQMPKPKKQKTVLLEYEDISQILDSRIPAFKEKQIGTNFASTVSSSISDIVSPIGNETSKRKRVTWAPEKQLCSIRYFERDILETSSTTHQIRDFDKEEGRLMRQPILAEWEEPHYIKLVHELPFIVSPEAIAQKNREALECMVVYFDEKHVPPSPAEPPYELTPMTLAKIIRYDADVPTPFTATPSYAEKIAYQKPQRGHGWPK